MSIRSALALSLHRKTGVTYVCNGCQAFALQPFGKVVQVQGKGPNINTSHKNMAGPSIGPHCEHCGSAHHVRAFILYFPPFLEASSSGIDLPLPGRRPDVARPAARPRLLRARP